MKPEELFSRVVTVGDPGRVVLMANLLDEVYFQKSHREFTVLGGAYRGCNLNIISTGIGTDNIDIVLNELALLRDMQENPAETIQLLRLGTCGALNAEIAPGSVVISEAALAFDGLLPFYQHDYPQLDTGLSAVPRPFWVKADRELLSSFHYSDAFYGTTVTAAGFYGPQGRDLKIPLKSPDWPLHLVKQELACGPVLNMEMETAGIYGLGPLLNMQCLSLSLVLANRVTGQFATKPQEALFAMLEKGLSAFSELRSPSASPG